MKMNAGKVNPFGIYKSAFLLFYLLINIGGVMWRYEDVNSEIIMWTIFCALSLFTAEKIKMV